MTKYLKIMRHLFEDEPKNTKARTKTKTSTKAPIDGFEPQINHPVTNVPPPEPEAAPPPRPERPTPPAPNRRGGPWTREMQDRIDHLLSSDILGDDEISDEEAYRRSGRGNEEQTLLGHPVFDVLDAPDDDIEDLPAIMGDPDEEEPMDVNDLPAVMNTAIQQTGDTIRIDWKPIRHLPGYVINQIRKMGRIVFQPFTDTPIEDIYVISSMAGNSDAEVRSLFRWVQKNATKIGELEMDLSEYFGPGYKPLVQFWSANGCTFELVHEPTMGQYYVYTWVGGMKPVFDDSAGNIEAEQVDDEDVNRLRRLR